MAAKGAAWAAKREKRVDGRASKAWLTPQNHQRPSDGMPFRAERVEEQLKRAAAQGEAARAIAAANKG